MIGRPSHRIDNGWGDPRCIHLSAAIRRPAVRPEQSDAALPTSSSRPAPHRLTVGPGTNPGWTWSPIAAYLKVLLPTTPEPAQSIDAGALQASVVGGRTGCTRIAPSGQTKRPGSGDPGRHGRLTRRLARPMAPPRRMARRLTGPLSYPAWTARRLTGLPCWPAWMARLARRLSGWPSWPACCTQLQRHRARPQEPGRAGFA
jgi:hypothetical protein